MKRGLRIVVATAIACLLLGLSTLTAAPAWAMTQIELKDLSYTHCPEEFTDGMVTAGSSQTARCYMIQGTAVNPTGKPVINADVFGRVYDANANPVMQNRNRLGAIEEVPPGESPFKIRISVAANQPEPLRLEKFKAAGFTGKVRR
ncbi:MAG: hypothetical protein O3C67_06475 [Cyanobacteria bacterium]|nr:hypothetical protein [Cyanobacteriota bacterium]